MFRYKVLSIEEMFALYDAPGGRANIDGHFVKVKSPRIQLFREKGTICVGCDLEASYFVLETHREDVVPHFNLYGVRDGREILFTKNHIHPYSKGGLSRMDNYQTMCTICNGKKADKVLTEGK